jgi:hypothetical protein
MAEHTPAPLNHEDVAYKYSKAKLEAAERDGYKQITARTSSPTKAMAALEWPGRLPWVPLCQRSCRLNRIGTFGGADSRKWLDTDKRTKIG